MTTFVAIGALRVKMHVIVTGIMQNMISMKNYLQQSTSADDIFRCIFFLAL